MYDAECVEVVDGVQDLVSQDTGILLCVATLGYDTVK